MDSLEKSQLLMSESGGDMFSESVDAESSSEIERRRRRVRRRKISERSRYRFQAAERHRVSQYSARSLTHSQCVRKLYIPLERCDLQSKEYPKKNPYVLLTRIRRLPQNVFKKRQLYIPLVRCDLSRVISSIQPLSLQSSSPSSSPSSSSSSPLPVPDSSSQSVVLTPTPPGRRKKHADVPHKVTYNLAYKCNDELDRVAVHHLGAFTDICMHCNAIFFESEHSNRSGERRVCCENGNVVLPPLGPCPLLLQEYLTVNNPEANAFRQNIRAINSLFAMASFKTSAPDSATTAAGGGGGGGAVGQGHWSFSICGQIYHFAEPIPSTQEKDEPKLNQYYFVDVEDAVNRRVTFLTDRLHGKEIIISNIEGMLRSINPWVKSYLTMNEVIKEHKERGQSLENMVLAFTKENINRNLRNFNLPESRSDVAAVFCGDDPPFEVNLKVYPRDRNKRIELKNLNPLCDPMVYPLLFPHGELGYDITLRHTNNISKTVTMMEFYRYRLHIKRQNMAQGDDIEAENISILHYGDKIFQQYLVDAYCKVEANKLWWYKNNQKKLRHAGQAAIEKMLEARMNAATNATLTTVGAGADGGRTGAVPRIGKITILPSSFPGSVRNQQRKYLDAMTVVARLGKPDLFITMTCNPHWPEISDNLLPISCQDYAYGGGDGADGVQRKQQWQHRPDLICRVFNEKLNEFMNDINIKQVYGVVLYSMYVIEFQKRGLPHAHILVALLPEDKPDTEEKIDQLISAYIPDRDSEPELYNLIQQCYIHRPCGRNTNPNAPCMEEGKCSKGYPKRFRAYTVLRSETGKSSGIESGRGYVTGQPEYRRPKDGRTCIVNGVVVDNRRVIPYNRYAAKKFNCHINFEICGSIKSMKYLHKYVYKGSDCITIQVKDNNSIYNWDEVSHFLDCRYVSSMEATWKLFGYKMGDRTHAVIVLPVHLENDRQVLFDENQTVEEIESAVQKRSKLEAYFALNVEDPDARQYKYYEIPEHYVWVDKEAKWKKRTQKTKIFGDVVEVSPRETEKFYLKMLLQHTTGKTSFEDIRTVSGDVVYDSYYEACKALKLLENVDEYADCIREASLTKMPNRLRDLFGLICITAVSADPTVVSKIGEMFDEFVESMCEDFISRNGNSEELAKLRCLLHIFRIIERNMSYTGGSVNVVDVQRIQNTSQNENVHETEENIVHFINVLYIDTVLQRCGLPNIDVEVLRTHGQGVRTLGDFEKKVSGKCTSLSAVAHNNDGGDEGYSGNDGDDIPLVYQNFPGNVDQLNENQRSIFDEVMETIRTVENKQQNSTILSNLFYIDAPGGTGKTFLFNTLIKEVAKLYNGRTMAMAGTGIAASLLIGGRTVHKSFRLPLNISSDTRTCGFPLGTRYCQDIQDAALIVWDEAAMSSKYALHLIDTYLRDIMCCQEQPLGGKVVVFGGDFRQILPIVVGGHRTEIIATTIKASFLWPKMNHRRLYENLRAGPDELEYANWLLKLGDGTLPHVKISTSTSKSVSAAIPPDPTIPDDLIQLPNECIVTTKEHLIKKVFGRQYEKDVANRVILCPTNASVNDINNLLLQNANPSETIHTYYSIDTYKQEPNDELKISDEYLHTIRNSSIPPHELRLKKGSVVMLLRNVDIEMGQCNGARCRVISLKDHYIELELLTGMHRGHIFYLPKIKMEASDPTLPRPMTRYQFPVVLAYAITINKSQGQTFRRIGIYLENACFSHGQLYVAFSRTGSLGNVYMCVNNTSKQGKFKFRTGKVFTRNIVYTSVVGSGAPLEIERITVDDFDNTDAGSEDGPRTISPSHGEDYDSFSADDNDVDDGLDEILNEMDDDRALIKGKRIVKPSVASRQLQVPKNRFANDDDDDAEDSSQASQHSTSPRRKTPRKCASTISRPGTSY